MILFGLKYSREPQKRTEADSETLRQHGLNQAEILELIAMSAVAVYANIIADATAMEEDAMFSQLLGLAKITRSLKILVSTVHRTRKRLYYSGVQFNL